MFDIDSNNNIIIKEPVLLLIQEYKIIWDSDTSKSKSQALKDLAFTYLKYDFKSPYRNAYEMSEIDEIIKRDLDLPKKWNESNEIKLAGKKLQELQTTKSLKTLLSAELALEQIIKYFEGFKLDSIDKEDRADAVSKLMNNIKNIDDVVGKLESAKKRVIEELETKKLSGTKVLSPRELPKSKRK